MLTQNDIKNVHILNHRRPTFDIQVIIYVLHKKVYWIVFALFTTSHFQNIYLYIMHNTRARTHTQRSSNYTKDNCSRSCYFKTFRAKPIGEYINLIRHTRGGWSMHSLFLSSTTVYPFFSINRCRPFYSYRSPTLRRCVSPA